MYEKQKQALHTAIANHRLLWSWLSKNPEASPIEFITAQMNTPTPAFYSYLCEYGHYRVGKYRDKHREMLIRTLRVYSKYMDTHGCTTTINNPCNCPVRWPREHEATPQERPCTPCMLYIKRVFAATLAECQQLTEVIRDLPMRIIPKGG